MRILLESKEVDERNCSFSCVRAQRCIPIAKCCSLHRDRRDVPTRIVQRIVSNSMIRSESHRTSKQIELYVEVALRVIPPKIDESEILPMVTLPRRRVVCTKDQLLETSLPTRQPQRRRHRDTMRTSHRSKSSREIVPMLSHPRDDLLRDHERCLREVPVFEG